MADQTESAHTEPAHDDQGAGMPDRRPPADRHRAVAGTVPSRAP
ncbi:MAG TPA: hypothetical protein VES95_05795 [Dermatophilaceae bacterium]|nr:hypothetical protein [Dermatophilaceae bacterium]